MLYQAVCATGARPSGASLMVARGNAADFVGQLGATLERARELPGRVADAQRLRHRLLLRIAEIDRRQARIEDELERMSAEHDEFAIRRARLDACALDEERLDLAAMLDEVDRILQRLRRERRALLYRLAYGEALAASLPSESGRASVREMLKEARRGLGLRPLSPSAHIDV